MQNEALISVIIPVYNVENYLAACLDSVLSQSYRNLEIIIIDDGSTDFSLKIAESYCEKEDRITVYSFNNSGLSEARNRGIEVATGEYITFVDSDDILLPEALQTMVSLIEKYKADLIEGLTVKGVTPAHYHLKTFKVLQYSPLDAIADVLYQKRLLPSACGKLYKKSLFENLRFEKGILYEDLDIFYKILEKCSLILWTNSPVYFYRINDKSIINTWKPARMDVLKVTENIENYIRDQYPSMLPSAQDRRLSANFNIFSLSSIYGDQEIASKCWDHIKDNRKKSFFNPNVRIKNKAGILLSYFGKRIFSLVARRIYK